jgi:hypothetical protein
VTIFGERDRTGAVARRFGSLVGTGLVLVCAPALAFPSSELAYTRHTGAEHCPDEAAVRASVAARLGYDPFVAEAPRSIVASIALDRGRLAAIVRLIDASGASHGRRELFAPVDRCGELVRAMALSISIAIDPERAEASLVDDAPESAAPPESAAESGPEEPEDDVDDRERPITRTPAPAPDPRRDPGSTAAGSRRTRLALFSGAGAHAAVGTAPSATGGAFVFAGLQINAISIALEGRADASGSSRLDEDASVSSTLFAATLLPCFHAEELFACASGTAGVIRASADGVSVPESDDGLFAAAGARGGVEMPLTSDLRLRFHLDFWLTLTRVEATLDQQVVWRAPAFSGATGLGLMARF